MRRQARAPVDGGGRAVSSPTRPTATRCIRTAQPVTAPAPLKSAPATGHGGAGAVHRVRRFGRRRQRPARAAQQMATVPFDFMIHTGDIAYDGGTRAEFESKFFGVYAAARCAAGLPGQRQPRVRHAPTRRRSARCSSCPRTAARTASSAGTRTTGATFTSSRSTPSGPAPVQAAWLDADLTANQLPWTIVYWHKPPFSSGEHGNDGGARTVLRADPGEAPGPAGAQRPRPRLRTDHAPERRHLRRHGRRRRRRARAGRAASSRRSATRSSTSCT